MSAPAHQCLRTIVEAHVTLFEDFIPHAGQRHTRPSTYQVAGVDSTGSEPFATSRRPTDSRSMDRISPANVLRVRTLQAKTRFGLILAESDSRHINLLVCMLSHLSTISSEKLSVMVRYCLLYTLEPHGSFVSGSAILGRGTGSNGFVPASSWHWYTCPSQARVKSQVYAEKWSETDGRP